MWYVRSPKNGQFIEHPNNATCIDTPVRHSHHCGVSMYECIIPRYDIHIDIGNSKNYVEVSAIIACIRSYRVSVFR